MDASAKPYYLLFVIQRWLTLVLSLITTAIVIIVVSVAMRTRDDVSIGFTAVSLTQLIGFISILKMTIAFWGQLDTSIGAVSRITDLAKEAESENKTIEESRPPIEWSNKGRIEIQGLSVSYS